MGARVTSEILEVLNAGGSSPRTTGLTLEVLQADLDSPVEVTAEIIEALVAERNQNIQVTGELIEVLCTTTVTDPVDPVDPEDPDIIQPGNGGDGDGNGDGDGSDADGIGDGTDLIFREPNPYRPTIPSELEDLGPIAFDYLREQEEIIREQHNLIQMGDTTYGWEYLTDTNVEAAYKPGSLGRFYHDDYGMIIARYCQFVQMVSPVGVGVPVGLLKTDTTVTWRVTNDITKSSPLRVIGVYGPYERPAESSWGWVIVDGPVIQTLPLASTVSASVIPDESPLVWSASGEVSLGGLGIILGYTRGNRTARGLNAGQAYVRPLALSDDSIIALTAGDIETLEALITGVSQRLEVIESVEGIDTTSIITSIEQNANAIRKETQSRLAAIAALAARIPEDSLDEAEIRVIITDAVSGLATSIATNRSRINQNKSALNAFKALVSGYNLGTIQPQINGINTTLVSLLGRMLTSESLRVQPVLADVDTVLYRDNGGLILQGFVDAESYFAAWAAVTTEKMIRAASSTDNALARWDGTDGRRVQDSVWLLTDEGYMGFGVSPPTSPIHVAGTVDTYLANFQSTVQDANAMNFAPTLEISSGTRTAFRYISTIALSANITQVNIFSNTVNLSIGAFNLTRIYANSAAPRFAGANSGTVGTWYSYAATAPTNVGTGSPTITDFYGFYVPTIGGTIVTGIKWAFYAQTDNVYFGGEIYAPNLPVALPGTAGRLWNDSGTIKIS